MKYSLLILLAISSFAAAQDIHCRVVGIADGDTLTCLTDTRKQLKVRLNQIDAPERGQAFGSAARKKLSRWVHGQYVTLKTDGADKYGRTLAEVFSGGLNINKEMVKSGYAWAYRKYVRDTEYIRLEERARAASLGLWSEPNPIYPSEFRNGKKAGMVTQQIKPSYAMPKTGGKFTCSGKRFCKEMSSCSEAKFYLNKCGVRRLDRDGDGIPCESIC